MTVKHTKQNSKRGNHVVQGLQHISGRVRTSGERMTQAGLALRLEAAQALLALERLDEAVDAFSLLKEWTSEGEITFPYVAGIMPTSVRQQAARGLAQVRCPKPKRNSPKPPVRVFVSSVVLISTVLLLYSEILNFPA